METDSITTEDKPFKSNFGSGENWKGNRKGRPKNSVNIANKVRSKTSRGNDLVDILLRIANDEKGRCEICGRTKESTQNVLTAVAELLNRGFGKAPITISDQDGNGIQVTYVLQRFEGQQALEQGPPIQTKVIEINPTSEDNHKM